MPKRIIPIRGSAQEFIEIEDIDRDIVMFIDGSAVLVITTTAVNFGLLSEKEQDAIIYAYAGFLNSLTFPIEILIRTHHKDISAYLTLLDEQEKKQKSPKLARNIHDYRLFVAKTVKEKDVLDKKFYIVIPFSSLELGVSPKILFGSKKRGLPYDKEQIFERALMVLLPKRDHIIRLLHRLGLQGRQLTNEQLVKLFFNAYNPTSPIPTVERFTEKHSVDKTFEQTKTPNTQIEPSPSK